MILLEIAVVSPCQHSRSDPAGRGAVEAVLWLGEQESCPLPSLICHVVTRVREISSPRSLSLAICSRWESWPWDTRREEQNPYLTWENSRAVPGRMSSGRKA